MRKDYQKAARGSIYAIAVMIAGMCFSASPAQSSTCFLPSGNCVTGKIDTKQDGGNETIEYCNGYDVSESEYNKKYNNTSCFSCGSPCTRTSGGTFYKCETVNNTKWYDDYNVCCTNGTKYDAADKACCPSGGCNHPCPAGKSWSKALQNCVCPSNVETDGNGNCCAPGQVLDENKNCTTPCTPKDCSSYPYTSDPGNSEKCDLGCNKGTRYKCKSGYTYSGGKCILPPSCPADYSTKYQSVNDCGPTGEKGYDFESNGTLNGKICGLCIASNCDAPYGPGVTEDDCKVGEVYSTNGRYDGEDICGLCSKPTEIRDIYITAVKYEENGLGYYYLKASEPVHTVLVISLSVDVYYDERNEDNGTSSSSSGCQMQASLTPGETIGEKDRCDKMEYNNAAANNIQFYINYKDTGKPSWDNKVIDGYRYHWSEAPQVIKPTITITMEYDSKSDAGSSRGSVSSSLKFTNSASDGKSYTVKLIINGDGDNGINYPLTVTQGNWVTYSSRHWESSDCDVYGDCRGDEQDRDYASDASNMSVMINNKTVQTGLPVTSLAGKTYETNDYKIKFKEIVKDYTITVTDTTMYDSTDQVAIGRVVTCTDNTVAVDVISNADIEEERSDWNCNVGYGSASLTIKNGVIDTYWNVNMEGQGECDYTRTTFNWTDTTVKIGSTTRTYKNTSCKEDKITIGDKTYTIKCDSRNVNVERLDDCDVYGNC